MILGNHIGTVGLGGSDACCAIADAQPLAVAHRLCRGRQVTHARIGSRRGAMGRDRGTIGGLVVDTAQGSGKDIGVADIARRLGGKAGAGARMFCHIGDGVSANGTTLGLGGTHVEIIAFRAGVQAIAGRRGNGACRIADRYDIERLLGEDVTELDLTVQDRCRSCLTSSDPARRDRDERSSEKDPRAFPHYWSPGCCRLEHNRR